METSQSLLQCVLILPLATRTPSWGALTTLHGPWRFLGWALEATQVGVLAAWWLLLGCKQRLPSLQGVARLAVPMPHAAAVEENRPKPLNLKRQPNIFHANCSTGHTADVHTEPCKDGDSHSSRGALSPHRWQRRGTRQSVSWHVTEPGKLTL